MDQFPPNDASISTEQLRKQILISHWSGVILECKQLIRTKTEECYYIFEDGSKEFVQYYSLQTGNLESNQKEERRKDIIRHYSKGREGKNIYKNKLSSNLTNHEKFQDISRITFSGDYRNGLQMGLWTIFYEQDQIGGGHFDVNGVKQGCWTDLHEKFKLDCRVTFCGEYKNGQRNGRWTILYKHEKIGGGNYDDTGMKSGNWTDLHQNFQNNCLVTFCGDYKNGLRVNQWTIYYKKGKIGGGKYDNGAKIGNWTDLCTSFSYYQQATICGEYRNGQRIGYWTIYNLKTQYPIQTINCNTNLETL